MTTSLDDVSRLPADPSLISLAYHHEHTVQAFEFDDTLEIWTVTARIDADAAAEEMLAHNDVDQETLDAIQDVTVGQMSFARVRVYGPDDPFEAMDSHSQDLCRIGETVLDTASGQWHGTCEDALAHPAGDLLVMDRVILEPAWRGQRVGPVLVGAAIRRLSNGCAAVACEPGSADGREMTEDHHRQAAAKLGRVWSTIGFEPFRDGVYLLDCQLECTQELLTERQQDFTALCTAWRKARSLP
ncbi:hypothetical protein [Streptomyces pseudogriseolus]|uniref:hypothetical protein n=1 Tax=Streptomyces pseudogriseolus TaxID=36817 RepID=UPI00346AB463